MRAAISIEPPAKEVVDPRQETIAPKIRLARSEHFRGTATWRAFPITAGVAAVGALFLTGIGVFTALRLGWVEMSAAAAAFAVHVVALAVVTWRFDRDASLDGLARLRPGAANVVTLLRTSLFAVVLALALSAPLPQAAALAALGLGAVALVLDGVDGFLARSRGTASAFGAWFDQETDAALIAALAILGWRSGSAGPWILVAGALRYGFLALLWWAPALRAELPFSQRRRVICVLQVAALLVCAAPFLTPFVTVPVAAMSVLLLTVSFAIDFEFLWRHRAAQPPGPR